jgi:hypothetical protein
MPRRAPLFLGILLTSSLVLAQQISQAPACRQGRGSAYVEAQNVQVRIAPCGNADDCDEDEGCRAIVRDGRENLLAIVDGWAITPVSINAPAAQPGRVDLNQDGIADVVLEGSPSGGRCCWTYWFVLGGDKPAVRQVESAAPAVFQAGSGGIDIVLRDSAFDEFDGVKGQTVAPPVVLRFAGTSLADVSAKHAELYDAEIRRAEQELAPSLRARLRGVRNSDQLATATREGALALRIVLSYLYSGRGDEAWRAVTNLWPAFDQQRIIDAIRHAYRMGIPEVLKAGTPVSPQTPKAPSSP